MARPRKEGMDYFPHDTDAIAEEKIEAMRALYNNDGYAFYFILLERAYRAVSGELDVSKAALLASVIKKIGVEKKLFEEMLETAFDLELFDREAYENRKVITSNGIRKRIEKVNEERDKWRGKGKGKQQENLIEKEDNPEVISRENLGDNVGGNSTENYEKTGESKYKIKEKEKKSNNDDDAHAREAQSYHLSENENTEELSSDSSKVVDPIIATVFTAYQNCIELISNVTRRDEILDLINQYSATWVIGAIGIAKEKQDTRNLNYINGILKKWKKRGYSTEQKPWETKTESEKTRASPVQESGAIEFLRRRGKVSNDR